MFHLFAYSILSHRLNNVNFYIRGGGVVIRNFNIDILLIDCPTKNRTKKIFLVLSDWMRS